MIKDILRKWLEVDREKANPVGAVTVFVTGDQFADEDKNAHLTAALINPYCYKAQQFIAAEIAKTPIILENRRTIDGIRQFEKINEHPLIDLLNRPNPESSSYELLFQTFNGLLATGDGYITITEDKKELWVVPPNWVTAQADKYGQIVNYKVTRHGDQTVEIAPEYMIHIRLLRPDGGLYGYPPSAAIKDAIVTKLSLARYLKNYFKNNGHLGIVLETDQPLDAKDAAKLKRQFTAIQGGDVNAFEAAVAHSGLKIRKITPDIKDIIPDAIEEQVRREIISAYGVPPISLGFLDGASYNNADKQDENFQKNTCEQHRTLGEGAISRKILPLFFRDSANYRLRFDRSVLPAFQEDMTALSNRAINEFRTNLITQNEARAMVGRETLPEGDVFIFDLSARSYMQAQTPGDAGPKSLVVPSAGFKAATPERLDSWKAQDIRREKHENKFSLVMRRFFDGQIDRLIERLNVLTSNGKFMSKIHVMKGDGLDPNELERIFDMSAENAALISMIVNPSELIVAQAGQEALDAYKINFDFNVANPHVDEVLLKMQNRITSVNVSSFRQIKRILRRGYENKEPLDKVAGALRDEYRSWTDTKIANYRAMRIARTESGLLVNGAANVAYTEAGVEEKEWLTAPGAEYPRHELIGGLDGQRRKIDQPFEVDGELLHYPSDPAGSAHNVINCRCALAPV